MAVPCNSAYAVVVKVSQVTVRPLPINLRRTLSTQGGPDIPTIHAEVMESQTCLKGHKSWRKEMVTEWQKLAAARTPPASGTGPQRQLQSPNPLWEPAQLWAQPHPSSHGGNRRFFMMDGTELTTGGSGSASVISCVASQVLQYTFKIPLSVSLSLPRVWQPQACMLLCWAAAHPSWVASSHMCDTETHGGS